MIPGGSSKGKVLRILAWSLVVLAVILSIMAIMEVMGPNSQDNPLMDGKVPTSQTTKLVDLDQNGDRGFLSQTKVDFGRTENAYGLEQGLETYKGPVDNSTNDMIDEDVESQSLAILALDSQVKQEEEEDPSELVDEYANSLLNIQAPRGDFNDDVGDTAMASYALSKTYSDKAYPDEPDENASVHTLCFRVKQSVNDSIDASIHYLKQNEDDGTWGSIEETAKVILALDEAGEEVDVRPLLDSQGEDGSFEDGDLEATAWAVMALTSQDDHDSLMAAGRAVQWLSYQEIDDAEVLGIVAAAEGRYKERYYEIGGQMTNDSIDGIPTPLPKPPPDKDPPLSPMTASSGAPGPGTRNVMAGPLGILLISGLLTAAIGIFANLRSERRILQGVRSKILVYIRENPGVHQARIKREFGLSPSSVTHHLRVLETTGFVAAETKGRYKRYFTNGRTPKEIDGKRARVPVVSFKERSTISILRNRNTRKIVKHIINNPNSSQKDIAKVLGLHPSTVHWHVERLFKAELLDLRRDGRNIRYSLNKTHIMLSILSIFT